MKTQPQQLKISRLVEFDPSRRRTYPTPLESGAIYRCGDELWRLDTCFVWRTKSPFVARVEMSLVRAAKGVAKYDLSRWLEYEAWP